MQLEDINAGIRLAGLIPGETAKVVATEWHGPDALEVTYRASNGVGERLVYRSDADQLSLAQQSSRPFNADASEFKLAAEAQRIQMAGLFDPMLAVSTSNVEPLPHQIQAVYGELLPRTPLRFLLADDPGAGKTIMAGLYIKELLLRDDVKRCLIVAPGGLVEQWQDELSTKFGLDFALLTSEMIESSIVRTTLDGGPLLIARMDQISRNDELQVVLRETEWDLIVVDEAHRMSAHYFGGKLDKTRRFQLGEMLSETTRHLLLMTATPHSGKEEDFQLFLTLLDRDRFEGKNSSTADTSGIMRRMIKEHLLKFDGTSLFPERIAETVPYEVTADELDLYERVTEYVRKGMNRADEVGGRRRRTVGFALTVLQRRLASSPEAIYQSLIRRRDRLTARRDDIESGKHTAPSPTLDIDLDLLDEDGYNAEQLEDIEEELMDAATAALTIEELSIEIQDLENLVRVARQVRNKGTDRKWTELSGILQDNALSPDPNGNPRKLIIFTEHRDTLEYLRRQISSLLGRPQAVCAIHGGVRRLERRQITEEFTHNSDVQILLATDAAGEGLNLQAAHLMVNYDLPWNPNRIEQRFGRIHRIGQPEVCRLWNLVASNTREGEVYRQLFFKIEEQRKAYDGEIFDVLGTAFTEEPLRNLLIEAIRYGEQPEVKARVFKVIDANVGDVPRKLMKERALATGDLADTDIQALRQAMDDARARRLQPHYIEMAFKAAFTDQGGRIARREPGRYEISNVPAAIRTSNFNPIATRYERVAFDLDVVAPDGQTVADLLAPGHPLHDAVMHETVRRHGDSLNRGAVLVSSTLDTPHLLVGVIEEITDGTNDVVARRFGYAYVDQSGSARPAGPAPYLDCVSAPDTDVTRVARQSPWLADAEEKAVSWIIANDLPEYLDDVAPRRRAEIEKTRILVSQRLENERDRLLLEAAVAAETEQKGDKPKESSESLSTKAAELDARLQRRLELLDRQAQMSTKPPRILTAALVLPLEMLEGTLPPKAPIHARETKAVERRGVDLVMASERAIGRDPVEQAFNNKGFDILSTAPNGDTYRIEVKARIEGADDFFVTHNEVITGKNAAPSYRLALVRVDERGPQHDEVRYLDDPFAGTDLGDFAATGVRGDWKKMWAKGSHPF